MSRSARYVGKLQVPTVGHALPVLPSSELRGLIHGTNADAADSILRHGFSPCYARRNYDFAEWGFGTTYLGRETDDWYRTDHIEANRRGIGDMRLVHYEVVLEVDLAPEARVYRIVTPEDADRLALAAGYQNFDALKSAIRSDPHVFPGVADEALQKLRDVGLDGVEVRMREWHEKNQAIAAQWTAEVGPEIDPNLESLFARGWSEFHVGPDQLAVFNSEILRAQRLRQSGAVAGGASRAQSI